MNKKTFEEYSNGCPLRRLGGTCTKLRIRDFYNNCNENVCDSYYCYSILFETFSTIINPAFITPKVFGGPDGPTMQ